MAIVRNGRLSFFFLLFLNMQKLLFTEFWVINWEEPRSGCRTFTDAPNQVQRDLRRMSVWATATRNTFTFKTLCSIILSLKHRRHNRLRRSAVGWLLSEENPSGERKIDSSAGVPLARYAVWASRMERERRLVRFYSSSLACLITKLCRLSKSRPPWCSSPCSPALKMIKVG